MAMNILLIIMELACIQAILIAPKPLNEVIVSATSRVLLESFEDHCDTLLIFILLTDTLDNPIGSILGADNQYWPAVITTFQAGQEMTTKQRYNVVLVDSLRSVVDLRALFIGKRLDLTGFYLVVLLSEANQYSIMEAVLLLTTKLHVYNVNVLYSVDDYASLYTHLPYESQITGWNTFKADRFSETSRPHFPSKFRDFSGAPLRIVLFKVMPFMDFIYDDSNKTIVDYVGIEGSLLKMISRSLNFTIIPVIPPNNLRWGTLLPNGTATGAMGMLLDGTVDLTLGFFGNNYLRQRYLSEAQSHYQTSLILIITPGSRFGSIEKLLLPFQYALWMCFGIVFAVAVVTIVVLKQLPSSVRHFVFGRGNHTPALNLFQVTLGNSVLPVPLRNFARFVLSLWIMSTFVLRSAYQQVMFYNLHHAQNHSTIDNWDDFIASGYRIYTTPPEKYLFANLPTHIQRQISIIPAANTNATLQAIRNGHLHGTRLSYPESVYYLNLQAIMNGGPFYRQFRERLYSYSLSVFFRKNSPLVDVFDEEVQPLVTHGFLQHWTRLLLDRKLLDVIKARGRRARMQSLSVTKLAGVFGVFGVGIACSIVVFLGELFVKRYLRL